MPAQLSLTAPGSEVFEFGTTFNLQSVESFNKAITRLVFLALMGGGGGQDTSFEDKQGMRNQADFIPSGEKKMQRSSCTEFGKSCRSTMLHMQKDKPNGNKTLR